MMISCNRHTHLDHKSIGFIFMCNLLVYVLTEKHQRKLVCTNPSRMPALVKNRRESQS